MDQYRARQRLIADIKFKFPVDFVVCESYGSNEKLRTVLRMENDDNKTSDELIGACVNDTQNAPTHLSLLQTNDDTATLARHTGNKTKECKALICAMLPDGILPAFRSNEREEEFIYMATNFF